MNKRALGAKKEAEACRYLEKKGYRIIDTNVWFPGGEIDIVAYEGEYLVFIEVKYRKNTNCGGSMYAVGYEKMRRISRCVRYYICREHVALDTPMRFDIVAWDGEQIHHVENAFEYIG